MLYRRRLQQPDMEIARGLGWASIAIGLTELAMPRKLDQVMGTGDGQNQHILRLLGVREIMHGVDILAHDDPTPGVWGRVAGDALDSALLGIAATRTRRPGGLMTIFALVLPIVVLDLLSALRLSSNR